MHAAPADCRVLPGIEDSLAALHDLTICIVGDLLSNHQHMSNMKLFCPINRARVDK